MADDFDVFLSYNSQDRATVLRIAEHLKEYGLRPWLDVEELRPGLPWQDGLEQAIGTTRAAAICIGPHGKGSWQIPEIRAFLSQMVKRGLPVIPLLLPGAPQAPDIGLFLGENTWVDLRNGVTEEGLDRLVWGITGKKPERNRRRSKAPPLHNLPFQSLGDLLKGRDDELRRLQAALDEPGGAAAITQSETISGLGGIGKTRLAVEHAWRCGDRYTAAWFVRADSPEGLRRSLAALAGPALLNLPERQAQAEEEIAGAVLRWLRANPGWLLILDNVDTKDAAGAVLEILPSLSGGRILITSRLREWPANFRKQPLDTIGREEAIRFLLQRTEGERETASDDVEQADRLADVLGDLPLALEQAAAYIAHNRMRFADYLESWQRERVEVLSWYDPQVMQYPASVAVTWQKTFHQLGPTAGALLRLTAFLAPDPIPVAMFEEGEEFVREAAKLLAEETGGEPDEQTIRAALADLAAYSMVARQKGDRLTVHRMVQQALRGQIPEERRREWIERALWIVNRYSPFGADDVRTWPIWDLLRPHVVLVLAWADSMGISEPTARLMGQLALLLNTKGLYTESEPLIRRALAIDEASFGTGHPNVAVDLNNLALLLKDTNRMTEAEPLMRRALAISEASFGPEHPAVAIRLNNLALLLQATNRLAEAEPLMRRALAIGEASFGTEHPAVAIRLNNLALLLQATNRLAEAEPLMRRTLAIGEASFGPEHPAVAIRLNNLAQLLQATNRLAEAEPLMRRALAIDEVSFGTEHPNVARDLNNLASLLQDTNRLAEAEPLMRRALAIDEASFGTEHPNVARDLNNLAQLLKATNRLAEAEALMRRALAIDEASFGPSHPEVATDLNNLALLLKATNRLVEAEPLMRRTLAIDEASFGTEHPNVARDLNNLAQLLKATNRLVEAEPLMRRTLAIDEASFGTEHPNVARDLNNLAQLLKATNRLAKAEALMRRALAIDEASFGPSHPEVATDLNNLALLLKDTNRLIEAEPLMRRAVRISEESLVPDHPLIQSRRRNLAALLKAKDVAETQASQGAPGGGGST